MGLAASQDTVSSPALVLVSCRLATAPGSPWASAVKLLSASVVITAARTAKVPMVMMPDEIRMILAPGVRNLNMVSSDYQR